MQREQEPFNEEQALEEYTRLMEAGPLEANGEALRTLIKKAYAQGMYFDQEQGTGKYRLVRPRLGVTYITHPGKVIAHPADGSSEVIEEAWTEVIENEETSMDIREIIADPTLSVDAKVILVTGELGKQMLEAGALPSNLQPGAIEINLICEDIPFHPYHAIIIPRVGEIISCRLEVGKGMLATLWRVTQVEHGVGLNFLGRVDIIVEPSDNQTAALWQQSQHKKKTE